MFLDVLENRGVGATFAFAVSIGEFGASILLVSPELTTIPVNGSN